MSTNLSPSGIGGHAEIELPPMSLRDIQAQGGRITSPRPHSRSSKKKARKLCTKIPEKEDPALSGPPGGGGGIIVQNFLSKLRQEPGRVVGGMDEQLAAAKRTSNILDEQLKNLKDEHGEMKDFIRDVLYTLNARGYESITDSHGGLIDLNRCQGVNFLDLKGRDARARQHCTGKRLQGQEHLLKAVIGSQEKLIRSLINQLNNTQKTEIVGSRLFSPAINGQSPEVEAEKSAILEKEILGLVNSLEAAIERHPGIYVGLKEQLLLEGTRSGSGSGILTAVLARRQLTTLGERSLSTPLDENRNRSGRVRRKLVPYSGGAKRHGSSEDLRFLNTVGKSFGCVHRDRPNHLPRPPTPGTQSTPLNPGLYPIEDDLAERSGPFTLRPVLSNQNLMGPATTLLRRPVTSINEYSSRKLRRGMSRWTF